MVTSIEENLKRMAIDLPEPPKPVASYTGYVIHNGLVYISGQLPFKNGVLTCTGLLGDGVDMDEAVGAARQCAINLLAQLKAACDGDLEKTVRCIRLGGFVASTPTFTDHPVVINGASDLVGEVLGKRGVHARAAVGVAALPLNASVEVDAIFAISA